MRKISLILVLLAMCIDAFSGSHPAFAATITVQSGVAISSNGVCSLREAVINANNDAATHANCAAGAGDDIIVLPAGTYTLSDAIAANEDFSVSGDVDIRSNITLTGAGMTTTVLDGNNSDRILQVVSGVVTLNHLTIRNGRSPNGTNATGNCTSDPCIGSDGNPGAPGGGILNAGNLTLNQVTVSNNRTGNGGNAGSISCSAGSCNNSGGAGGAGAGVHSSGTSLIANNSVLTNNQTGAGGAAGAVLSCIGGAMCNSFTGNRGSGGGANQPNAGTLTFNNCLFANNISFGGGAISASGTFNFSNGLIRDNQAFLLGGGGIQFSGAGNKSIVNSTISGNIATGSGGGIFANLGTLFLTNVTISNNTSGIGGGGIFVNVATTTLNHTSIVGNIADSDANGSGNGGGIFRNVNAANLKNSVLAGNLDLGGEAPNCAGTVTSLLYNHIQDVTGCTFTPATGDAIGSNPGLELLADNGGPTFTHTPGAGSVLENSIPNGTNDCGTLVSSDQRGVQRSYGGACDKGAVELRQAITVGNCAGADLSGAQSFAFTSGSTLGLNVLTANGLKCVTIEEMGPGVDHLQATAAFRANNWWRITGNINGGFVVALTLPYASASALARVCRSPGGAGDSGWDCGPQDGSGTSFVANVSVTRAGVSSFSDWEVGEEVVFAGGFEDATTILNAGASAALSHP